MSKLSKLLLHPGAFFVDAVRRRSKPAKRAAQQKRSEIKAPAVIKAPIIPKDTDLAKKLIELESTYPVNNIVHEQDGQQIHFWPLIRHALWSRCQAAARGNDASKVNTYKINTSHEWLAHLKTQYEVFTPDELPQSNCDFLFISNQRGTEQTTINGSVYGRIVDPVLQVAQDFAVVQKAELLRNTGEFYPGRIVDTDFVFPTPLRLVGRSNYLTIPESFWDAVASKLPEAKLLKKQLNDVVEWFWHQVDVYGEMLDRYNPRVVLFVGFDFQHALIHACKIRGIISVDLQHGTQIGWSPVYNHWNSIPRGGYDLFPDVFWVWGEYDAEKLATRLPPGSSRVVVGGFPWLDRQMDLVSDVASLPFEHEVDGLPIGVLTLQDQKSFPPLFLEIIDRSSSQIRWVIKRHPKHKNINLKYLEEKAVFGDAIDQISFAKLVKYASIHLTECSTSVVESDHFGVPSVVTDASGEANFCDFITDGSVWHVRSADDFMGILQDLLDVERRPRMGVINNRRTVDALNEILKMSSDKRSNLKVVST